MKNKLISNLISTIQVNYRVKNKYAKINYNKKIIHSLIFLKKKGYILNYKIDYENKHIFVFLKYKDSSPLITNFSKYKGSPKRMPSLDEINILSKNNPYSIMSSKKGLLFLREAALKGLSGKILFELKI